MNSKEAKKNRIIGRKCPSCMEEITHYIMCGIFIPTENKAVFFSKEMLSLSDTVMMPFGQTSMVESYSIYLLSQCNECGLSSLWAFNEAELLYLLNNNEKYSLMWIYNAVIWEELLEKVKNEQIKKYILSTINLCHRIYKEQEAK